MDADYRGCLAELRGRDLLPPSYLAVYAGGSLVRGWGNARSDLDIYVVSGSRWQSREAQLAPVGLHPDTVPVEGRHVDGVRWDIEYWLAGQVDELFDKVSASRLEGTQPAGQHLTDAEVGFLDKLRHSVPIDGERWWRTWRTVLAERPVPAIMALRALHHHDIHTEDALGQLAAGDVHSAVLSVKIAWRHAVEALLASHGEFGESPKWLARRFRAARPAQLAFEDYWAVETMRSYDPADPGRWVDEVLGLCQRIATGIEL